MNSEFKKYQDISVDDLYRIANEVLMPTNSNTLWYLAEN
jgi:hypothetical protein